MYDWSTVFLRLTERLEHKYDDSLLALNPTNVHARPDRVGDGEQRGEAGRSGLRNFVFASVFSPTNPGQPYHLQCSHTAMRIATAAW
jgi:hypothetical protein